MKQERKNYILEKIRTDKKVNASDVVKEFNVTMETVRRDLEDLENHGLLRRIYGGAVEGKIYDVEPSYDSRMVTNLDAKKKLAVLVCDLIKPNETIFIDGGTTLLEVANELVRRNIEISVVTNALQIAITLSKASNIKIVMLGGFVSDADQFITKLLNPSDINVFNFDKSILGVASINRAQGVTDYNLDVSIIKREMIKRSRQHIFVADSSKFGKFVKYTVADFGQIDYLITDSNISKKDLETCKNANIKLLIAKV